MFAHLPSPMHAALFGLLPVLVASALAWAAIRPARHDDAMRAAAAFEALVIHRKGRILCANARFHALIGRGSRETVGAPIADILRPADGSAWADTPGEVEILGADGQVLTLERLVAPMSWRGGAATAIALRDIGGRVAAEARIRHIALHDGLTDLPNRRLLDSSLTEAIGDEAARPVAVMCLDLDGFKSINDRFGHPAGDLVLRETARRLREICGERALIARLGGDEFVVMLTQAHSTVEVALIASRIVASLARPFALDTATAWTGTSIGTAICPQDGDTAEALLHHADLALYRAKALGKGRFCRFEGDMLTALRERQGLEDRLRAALAADALSLYFQPLFDADGTLTAFEALVRWHHDTRGFIPTEQFIALAEQCGLGMTLGDWVLRQACLAASGWAVPCNIAINLTAARVHSGSLAGMVRDALEVSSLPPGRLEIEINEGALLGNATAANSVLNDLRALGVRIVLDDFGAGYATLAQLHSTRFDKIKIDRALVSRIEDDTSARIIVDAAISMGQELAFAVAAKGVETDGQLDLLRDQGCDELQGFLLGVPVPADEVDALMSTHIGLNPFDGRNYAPASSERASPGSITGMPSTTGNASPAASLINSPASAS